MLPPIKPGALDNLLLSYIAGKHPLSSREEDMPDKPRLYWRIFMFIEQHIWWIVLFAAIVIFSVATPGAEPQGKFPDVAPLPLVLDKDGQTIATCETVATSRVLCYFRTQIGDSVMAKVRMVEGVEYAGNERYTITIFTGKLFSQGKVAHAVVAAVLGRAK